MFVFAVICQEDAWFDSVSILESDSDDEYSSVHGGNENQPFPLSFMNLLKCCSINIIKGELLNESELFLVIFSFHFSTTDCFPIVGNTIGNIAGGQMVQYKSSACIMDNDGQVEEYHESYVEIDRGKADKYLGKTDSKRKRVLDPSYGSFKGLIDERRDSEENNLKPSLARVVPTVSFNDKTLSSTISDTQPQRRKSAVFRLSFKRRSCEGEETTELCK